MSGAGTKLGVGTHFRLDGETVEVVEFASLATGMEVVLKDGRDRLARMSLRELLTCDRAELIHDRSGPSAADDEDLAARTALITRVGRLRREIGHPLLTRTTTASPMKLTQIGEAVVAAIHATGPRNQGWLCADLQDTPELGPA